MMNDKQNKHDKLSYALHAAVKRELLSDPDRVLAIAKNNLKRWRKDYGKAPKWMSDWSEILEQGVTTVVKILDGKDEASTLLRSSSPFTGVISLSERACIMKELGWREELLKDLEELGNSYNNGMNQSN